MGEWSELYREYFSRMDNGRYAIPTRRDAIPARMERGRYAIPDIEGSVYDWTNYQCDEFIIHYIKPQRLRHSAGFALHNTVGLVRGVYCLDRIARSGFSPQEVEIMRITQPHLDNLHKNLFVLTSRNSSIRNPKARQLLTTRESEIADLLCRGMTPSKIGDHLCLSLSTIYRHIANMHTKLDVSNRQELLLKLMDDFKVS